MSVNTGHRARNPGVLWYGRARARVLEYGFLSSYARFRIQRVAHLPVARQTREHDPRPSEGRSPACRPVTAREVASPLPESGTTTTSARVPLKATQRVRETRSKTGRGKTWELLGAIPLGAGPLAPNSSQVSPHVRDG